MHLVFKKDKTFICHQGCNSAAPRENPIQLEANKEYIMTTNNLTDGDWENMIHIILDEENHEDKESIYKIMQGYIPQLTQAGKLSKTMTKGEHLLAKEAKLAAKEAKKTRIEALKKKEVLSTEELQEAVKLLLK